MAILLNIIEQGDDPERPLDFSTWHHQFHPYQRNLIPTMPESTPFHMSACIRKVAAFIFLLSLSVSASAVEPPSEAELAAAKKVIDAGGRVQRIAQSVETNEISFAFSREKVTDDSLAAIHEVPKVEWLYLQGTDISDDGLAQVARLTELTKLHLEKTKIGDAGLKHLTGLQKLEYLNLFGTNVSNAGIEHLKKMKGLKKVYLFQSKVDESGLAELQNALPDALVMLGAKPIALPKKKLASGQFVRVRPARADRILSLAEVEIFDVEDEAIQSNGQATQSSDYQGALAQRAIDGNTAAEYGKNSVTHTNTQAYPWWQVDFGEVKDISRIHIWNRKEVGDRLAEAIVEILDSNHQVVWAENVEKAMDGSKHEFAAE